MRVDLRDLPRPLTLDAARDRIFNVATWTGQRVSEVWLTDEQHTQLRNLLTNISPRWTPDAEYFTSPTQLWGARIVIPDTEWNWPSPAATQVKEKV
jgi:hypothetical protein